MRKLRWKKSRRAACISKSIVIAAQNDLETENVTMSQRRRLTGELRHDLLHSPSSGVSVAVGTVRSDQVVCQIDGCFNTNRTGLLQGENKQLDMMSLWAYVCGDVLSKTVKANLNHYYNISKTLPLFLLYSLGKNIVHSTWPSYKWQNPLMIFCLYSWSAFSSIRLMVCMVR